MFDILITDAYIIDGSGNPPYRADLGIAGDRIAAIGKLAHIEAARAIDAGGRVVCPGFIDAHAHSDLMLLIDPRHELKIRQGVTTEIIGQDGFSYAPVSAQSKPYWRRYLKSIDGDPHLVPGGWDWCSVPDYLARFGGAANVAYLLPHGNIRYEVMAMANRQPTPDELERMKQLVAQGMEAGAIGLSTGLGYVPGQYAATAELVELSKVAARYGGIYVSHLRDYMAHIDAAIEEIFTVGEEAGIPIHISHFNGRIPLFERTVGAAQARGLTLTYDVYPYRIGATSLFGIFTQLIAFDDLNDIERTLRSEETRAMLRQELAGWDWSLLTFSYVPGREELEGRNLQTCADEAGKTTIDFMCDLIIETDLAAGVIARHTSRTEEDLCAAMQARGCMFGSDGLFLGSHPNPRVAGAFPRVLARYVRELGALSLEDAIRKMTSLPAQTHHLHDRGVLKTGLAADIAIFDPAQIQDHATFEDGLRPSTGMDFVIVNGKIVLDGRQHTGATPGRALRRI